MTRRFALTHDGVHWRHRATAGHATFAIWPSRCSDHGPAGTTGGPPDGTPAQRGWRPRERAATTWPPGHRRTQAAGPTALTDYAGAPSVAGPGGRAPAAPGPSPCPVRLALDGHARQPAEPARHPPVPVAEQAHRRRQQHAPDERGIDQHGDRQPQPELLDDHQPERHEDREHHDHDRRRARDHARRDRDALRHGVVRRQPAVARLLDPGEDEDVVVHREPEQDGEDEDRHPRLEDARRLDAQHRPEPAVLEDEDHRAVGGARRQQVQDQRLQRDDQRVEGEHQQQEAERQHEAEDERHLRGEAVGAVQHERGVSAHARLTHRRHAAERRRYDRGPHLLHDGLVPLVVLLAAHGERDHGATVPS